MVTMWVLKESVDKTGELGTLKSEQEHVCEEKQTKKLVEFLANMQIYILSLNTHLELCSCLLI